jgi:sarcosine oxidase, subunit beta
VGQGASSRAAGMVRAQAGTPDTVRLGMWSIDFYRRQADIIGTDSGFEAAGYMLVALNWREEREWRSRVSWQQDMGLDVRWLGAAEAAALNPTLAAERLRGASYAPGDGWIDPPRNVRAYSLAMQRVGVELRERTPLVGLKRARGRGGRPRVTAVTTPRGDIATERVILTGGPTLRALGQAVDVPIWAGAVRHTVAVTSPHPDLVDPVPMVFDIGRGLYWRQEEGGLLFGFSDPEEPPGVAREIDWAYLKKARRRLARLVPVTHDLGLRKVWAATIDYSPDHLPLLGPAIARQGGAVDGVTVASASGHGMMFGPGVARVAVDLALKGATNVVSNVADFALDRFDQQGRSRGGSDAVALPFPAVADDTLGRVGAT